MAPPNTPTPFTLWLEDALTGWLLPVAGLLFAAGAFGLYYLGVLPEGGSAALLAALVGLLLALLMLRPVLSPAVDPASRGVTVLLALGTALLAALPAASAVVPGVPEAEGALASRGERLQLPAGLTGRVRLLVHAPLPAGGTPVVEFRLTGTTAPVNGQVERTVSYSRVGRGSRAAVAHDHNEVWVHGNLAPGAGALTLDRVDGPLDGPLQVAVYSEWIPPLALWLAALALVAVAAVWEVRLGRGNLGALAGMGAAYGLLVSQNATPASAIGTSLGAILLGALGGALAGGLLGVVAKLGPWKPIEPPRVKGASRKG
jgi:hypothetical protein